MFGGILVFVGSIVTLVGAIMILIRAFKTSILWGIGSLLIPLVAIIFALMHLEECKKGLIYYVIGIVLLIVGMALSGGTLPETP